ncbi:MAG: CDP-diacylglycerol--glycerol-3-phosphate 3-phosphatidyltransferase [Actinobacteria bacterium]|nr:MAG: CDP-diacylglycerol--glycerol-3-phosphate 3-phosphatidyltransferase [Actinomycetota bacterium]
MGGVTVGRRVDGDRADAQLAQRAEDADRDLAAVRDQHFAENRHCPRILQAVSLPDTLTVARAASVPFVVLLYAWNFNGHNYWATALFAAAMATDWFDGRIARSRGHSSPLGSLLDPAADKILVLAVLVMLVGQHVVPGWMVALIVVREFLVTALRLAALERGVVLQARDLGKLKTWSQAVAAAIGGFAAAGAWRDQIAWWALLVAVVLTWISGLDYVRVAPRLWRGGAPA